MSLLAGILQRKRMDVAERQRERPLAKLVIRGLEPPRSLAAALGAPGLRFILEVKQRSPSAGVLRSGFDPGAIAQAYGPVADAISVLTDGPFFQGSLEHLQQVRRRVSLPVLCKDFVVDPYQVMEARSAGADAILLMLSVLDDAGYRECAAIAARLEMDVLTEIHDEAELERAIRLGARIIGINNRDLATMTVNLETTTRLAPLVPPDRLVVAESGIRSREDVDRLAVAARCFLVGSEPMRAAHVGRAARTLVYGAVKICGLTREDDARVAYREGASYGGLVFAPESPRAVDQSRAPAIVAAAELAWVGVFVNDQVQRIVDLASRLHLAAVQLHGEETLDEITRLRTLLPPRCEIWKAVRVERRTPSREELGVDRVLLDGHHPELRGGTGRRFDWSLLHQVPDRGRIVMAGGLSPTNIRRAHQVGCGMLDVSSGVERAPGIKDSALLGSLFDALRSWS